MDYITLKTFNKTTFEPRNVSLMNEENGTVILLGNLDHGCKIIIDQELLSQLQKLVDNSILIREITNEELADIPCEWENSNVDTNNYYQSVMSSCEVDADCYKTHKDRGGLCQIYKGRFYIA